MNARPIIIIDTAWRSRSDGAELAISATTDTIVGTANWEQLEAFRERLAREILAKAELAQDVPLTVWHRRLFDTALSVLARYGELRMIGREDEPPHSNVIPLVIRGTRRTRASRSRAVRVTRPRTD